MTAPRRTLYHYTTAKGCESIVATNALQPSLRAINPKDARHGDGQYLSDVCPGEKTPGQLAYAFLNDPRGWRRFTHYVEIDVTELTVVDCRPGVFLIANGVPLDLAGRVVGCGEVPR